MTNNCRIKGFWTYMDLGAQWDQLGVGSFVRLPKANYQGGLSYYKRLREWREWRNNA